jgi:alpha-ketoglutarate-dependent taurine dioxygenase
VGILAVACFWYIWRIVLATGVPTWISAIAPRAYHLYSLGCRLSAYKYDFSNHQQNTQQQDFTHFISRYPDMAATLSQIVPLLQGKDSSSTPVTFEPFTLPATNQRELGRPHQPNTVQPLALQPTESASLDDAIRTIQTLQSNNTFTNLLATHGTLLFRGLPITSAADFSQFAHAFKFRPHEIIGIVVDRPLLAPNVAPANEAPPHISIYNHNESPQVPHAPEYIFFYCHKAPALGGETPISSSLELFARAQAEIPEFIDALTSKGILSRVVYKLNQQYEGGSTLHQAFGKTITATDSPSTRKAKIEAQIARYGRGDHTTWQWADDDQTLILSHHLPAVRTQQYTNLPTLFTGLAAYWKNAQTNNPKNRNITTQRYGDDSEIPDRFLEVLARITDEIRVLHRWQEGDVLVFDNVVAQHGRQPWVGEQRDRVVLASLFDGLAVPGAYSDAPWAQVVQASEG